MNTTTTLSSCSEKASSESEPSDDSQSIQITQVVSCIVRAEVKAEQQSREDREKLLRDHIEGTGETRLKKKVRDLFKKQ